MITSIHRDDHVLVERVIIKTGIRIQSRAETLKVPLRLEVFRSNKPAQKLYERLGFGNVGETRTGLHPPP